MAGRPMAGTACDLTRTVAGRNGSVRQRLNLQRAAQPAVHGQDRQEPLAGSPHLVWKLPRWTGEVLRHKKMTLS